MKKTVELSTKRKVDIREMSIDEMDSCQDITRTKFKDGKVDSKMNLSKARTAWLRHGICGGDFKKYKENANGQPEDSVLKELSEEEKNELSDLIIDSQILGE